MPSKSAIYIFTRDERSHVGSTSQNRASTDAAGVVFNWATGHGRSYQTLFDEDEFFIARLTSEESDDLDAGDDLKQRCIDWGLKWETITEMQAEKLRAKCRHGS